MRTSLTPLARGAPIRSPVGGRPVEWWSLGLSLGVSGRLLVRLCRRDRVRGRAGSWTVRRGTGGRWSATRRGCRPRWPRLAASRRCCGRVCLQSPCRAVSSAFVAVSGRGEASGVGPPAGDASGGAPTVTLLRRQGRGSGLLSGPTRDAQHYVDAAPPVGRSARRIATLLG